VDEQTNTSKNIIDKRSTATQHGISAVIGLLIGIFLGVKTAALPQPPDKDLVQITSTALDRGQTYWSHQVPGWRDAHVVLIDTETSTPCGPANKSTGPFYCPSDEHIYLDLSFLRTIKGDLARAYVVAHEIGHHVQKIRDELGALHQSVDIELGADTYAGCWMRTESVANHVALSEIDAALAEAQAVGDDRLCPSCSPETWTHGSSAARAAAVSKGLRGESCQ